MATQNIQTNPLLVTQNASFERVTNKNKDKQDKELLHLATILRELEQEVAQAKKGGVGTTQSQDVEEAQSINSSQGAEDGGENSFEAAMTEMALLLQMLQVDIVKYQKSKTSDETEMSNAMVTMYKVISDKIHSTIAKETKAEAKSKEINFWIKFAEIAVAVIVSVVALAFGQVEIAVMMIAMTAVSLSGAMNKAQSALANAIYSLLEKSGIDKELEKFGLPSGKLLANLIATIIILVVVVGATAALAPADAVGEVASVAEEASENAESSANAVEMSDLSEEGAAEAENTTNQTEQAAQKVSKLRQFLRKIRLPNKVNMSIMNVSQSLSQLNIQEIVLEIAQAQHKGKLSEKEKETLQIITEVIIGILALLGSLGAGDAIADSMSSGQVVGKTSLAAKLLGRIFNDTSGTMLTRILTRLEQVLQELGGSEGIIWMERVRRVLTTGEAGLQGWEGKIQIEQGFQTKDLAEEQVELDYIQLAVNSNSNEQADSQKQEASTLKQQQLNQKDLGDLFAGEKGLAQVLTIQSAV